MPCIISPQQPNLNWTRSLPMSSAVESPLFKYKRINLLGCEGGTSRCTSPTLQHQLARQSPTVDTFRVSDL